jgi:small subunit ribosomal protein S20
MANNAGAKKRIRQNAVRRLRNRYKMSSTRSAIKKLRNQTEKEAAAKLLPGTISLIDRCVKVSLFHRNKASRLKGHLTKFVNTLGA